MSDMITSNDPITTWADVRPTQRPLADLRQKRDLAWQMYDDAIERGALDIVRECQAAQAEHWDAEYRKAYDELNAAPPEECTCCLPEQICPVCASRGDPEIPY